MCEHEGKLMLTGLDELRIAVDVAKAKTADAEHAYLARSGWIETSSVPGCYWVWEKLWGTRPLMGDQALALKLQRAIDSGIYPPPRS